MAGIGMRMVALPLLLSACGNVSALPEIGMPDTGFRPETAATGREWIVALDVSVSRPEAVSGGDALEASRPLGAGLWLVRARQARRPAIEGARWMEQNAREVLPPASVWQGPSWLDENGSGGQQWGFDRIGARRAWSRTRGVPGVRVAVVDSGVDGTHPDLRGRLGPGIDLVDGDTDPADPNGHGTHVAGIIGATADDGLGISGVAPGVTLVPVRVMDAQGEGTVARVCEGIIKAADLGADVINLSIGSREGALAKQASVDHALAKGSVVVAAMGNSASWQAFYPAACRGVLAVGATSPGDGLADYSNYGVWMTLVAPGTRILSTLPRGRWWPLSGTSMAAPHVAGVAALVRSLAPGMAPAEVATSLRRGAEDLGPPGPDERHGAGLLNAEATLAGVGRRVASARLRNLRGIRSGGS
ncbi:MAG: S8 family peptidase [Candidatus Sericytochromatia bacterium]|nr:S8 family peptidase [Candidatus Sericytochromatia bacterium]